MQTTITLVNMGNCGCSSSDKCNCGSNCSCDNCPVRYASNIRG
jgi:hypothetical protein